MFRGQLVLLRKRGQGGWSWGLASKSRVRAGQKISVSKCEKGTLSQSGGGKSVVEYHNIQYRRGLGAKRIIRGGKIRGLWKVLRSLYSTVLKV